MKYFKTIALCATVFCAIALSSCGGGGIPSGRYVPVDDEMTTVMQAIVIDGNTLTLVMPFGVGGVSTKYKYSNGTITFTAGGVGLASAACEYRNDTLYYAGAPFVLSNYK